MDAEAMSGVPPTTSSLGFCDFSPEFVTICKLTILRVPPAERECGRDRHQTQFKVPALSRTAKGA